MSNRTETWWPNDGPAANNREPSYGYHAALPRRPFVPIAECLPTDEAYVPPGSRFADPRWAQAGNFDRAPPPPYRSAAPEKYHSTQHSFVPHETLEPPAPIPHLQRPRPIVNPT